MGKRKGSLSGARMKMAGGKAFTSRSGVTGRFVHEAVAKRNPAATITQKDGSGTWETRGARPTQAAPTDPKGFFTFEHIAPVVENSPKGSEPDDPALTRFVVALVRQARSLDLSEVERANGSMDAVAKRMLASIPGANVLDDRVGPFYDTAGLKAWFQMSRQALDVQAKAGDVLCVLSADGFRLYPSFQFDERGTRLPRLREVLAGLDPEQVDTWGDAVWLNAPAEELDGLTPAAALRTDRADEVVRLAQQAGAFRLG